MARKHIHKKHTASKKPASHRRHRSHRQNLTWLWVLLGVLVLVVVAGILFINPQSAPSTEISPAQAYGKYQQGAFFLDVRSQAEWEEVHIAGSTLIPLDELDEALGTLPKDEDIVVVCLLGPRSQAGVTLLEGAGFSRVFCLEGGIQAWYDAGYPIETGSP